MKINSYTPNYQNKFQKQPAFEADINLVSKARFNEIITQKIIEKSNPFEVGNIHNQDWTISQAAFKKPLAYTAGVYNCIAGSILNPETGLVNMFHLSPYKKTLAELEETRKIIIEQTKALKENTKSNLEGIIVGSNSSQIIETSYEKTLYKAIKELFNEMADNIGMNYSKFLGRKSGYYGINLMTDGITKRHYLNIYDCRNDANANKLKHAVNSLESFEVSSNDSLIT
jgi:hypothetical protein